MTAFVDAVALALFDHPGATFAAVWFLGTAAVIVGFEWAVRRGAPAHTHDEGAGGPGCPACEVVS